eukprot:5282148-Pleurochrysis_carterae.AAC.2
MAANVGRSIQAGVDNRIVTHYAQMRLATWFRLSPFEDWRRRSWAAFEMDRGECASADPTGSCVSFNMEYNRTQISKKMLFQTVAKVACLSSKRRRRAYAHVLSFGVARMPDILVPATNLQSAFHPRSMEDFARAHPWAQEMKCDWKTHKVHPMNERSVHVAALGTMGCRVGAFARACMRLPGVVVLRLDTGVARA